MLTIAFSNSHTPNWGNKVCGNLHPYNWYSANRFKEFHVFTLWTKLSRFRASDVFRDGYMGILGNMNVTVHIPWNFTGRFLKAWPPHMKNSPDTVSFNNIRIWTWSLSWAISLNDFGLSWWAEVSWVTEVWDGLTTCLYYLGLPPTC